MHVIKQRITTGSRKLTARWTVESMKDLLIVHYGGLHYFFNNDIMWHEVLPENSSED